LNQQDQFAPSQPANFNRLARVYRWLEWSAFGPILWKCRCAYLGEMKSRRSALVIGDGDGRFTAKLLKENPHIAIEAVDASELMLHQLMQRAGRNANRVRPHLADARQLQLAPRKFDFVATHFFLDCLTTADVESLAMRVRESLISDAAWVVSEFAIPDNWYGRFIARPIITALYFAFGCLTGLTIRELPRHREALQRAGFILTNERKWLSGLLVSELWKPGPQ
jgi:ubiquinone/menaquinone biosynthesis C-methylase UbiE